jgi:hypothetical protein
LTAKIQRIYKLVKYQTLKPIKKIIPIQLHILRSKDGRCSGGVCLPEISLKFIIAKNGAVRKESTVAILIKTPISAIKNNKIAIVPIAKKLIQNQ